MDNDLKLFVWTDVLHDYTSGMMVALAHDVEEARRLILEYNGGGFLPDDDLAKEPQVITQPAGFWVYGGG
jgi:hypothetical protein